MDVFSKFFATIQDPRQLAKVDYPLFDLLFLSVCGALTGASGWEDIEDFAAVNLHWLQQKGLFLNGPPTDDTIARDALALVVYVEGTMLCGENHSRANYFDFFALPACACKIFCYTYPYRQGK